MTGGNHSVATLLKKDCPHLIIFKCICHSFALCANSACNFLPKYIEGGARDIYNFIQNSPKRVELFSELQVLLDYNPRKMLHPSQTRWLSLEATVNQILSRLEVLKLFFLHEDVEKFDSTQRIINYLHNPEFELYLLFLKFILNDINKLNRLFQNESPKIHLLNSTINRLYGKIFECIVKEEYICFKKFKKIDINNTTFLKDPKDIYLGAEVSLALTKLSEECEKDFRNHCLQFYVELCNSLLKKFDFENDFLECVEVIAPANIVKNNNKSIFKLCSFVPNEVEMNYIQETDDEWRELLHINFEDLGLLEEENIETFWEVIFKTKRGDGTRAFPNLKKLVYAILSVPVATANVERIFSQININKNKTRNRLEVPTLCGILRTKDFLKKNNSNCSNFVQSKEMAIKFTKEMYKSN
ncbi:uncharacterized protein LOC124419838 isoform X2 [Lucilia cuprina]|nr:uncharacterized protein LOC124419838 isoform X2 [Lucilia cuprina]